MNHEMQATRDALTRDAAKAVNAFAATIQSIKVSNAPLNARAEALTHDEQRRSRAGVRVNMAAPDGLQQRATALLADMGKHFAAQTNEQAGHAAAMAMVLARALALIGDMAAELDGPEHAATVRAEAEVVAAAKQKARDIEYSLRAAAAHGANRARENAEHAAYLAAERRAGR